MATTTTTTTTTTNASKRIELAEKVIVNRFKDVRGSGAGWDYQPFITERDMPSTGRVHRLASGTVGRVHHLLSDLDHHVFCQLDWHQNVVDICEQFPIPLADSRSLA